MRQSILAFSLVALSAPCFAAEPGSGSGAHGGDSVRIVFAKARGVAADMLRSFKPIDGVTQAEVASWLGAHREDLQADVEETPTYVWTSAELAHDAMTDLNSKAPITLSLPLCRLAYDSEIQAAELLIHESVHHLGEASELLADAVAAAVSKAYTLSHRDAGKSVAEVVALTTGLGFGAPSPTPVGDAAAVWSDGRIHLFDFGARSWTAGAKAPVDGSVLGSTLVTTGESVFVWLVVANGTVRKSLALSYNPATNSWKTLSQEAIPTPRVDPYLVWTGAKVIVWSGWPQTGGFDDALSDSGGIYDVATNTWSAMSKSGKNAADPNARALWTGKEAVICCHLTEDLGAVYDLATDSWRKLARPKVQNGTVSAFGPGGSDYAVEELLPPTFNGRYSAAWAEGRLWVLGTFASFAGTPNARAASYNMVTQTWERAPFDRRAPKAGIYDLYAGDGKLWAFGGDKDGFPVHAFDLKTSRWSIPDFANADAICSSDSRNVWTGESLLQLGGSGGSTKGLVIAPRD